MYEIQYTNRFKKSMKLCAKRGLDTQLVFDAVDILRKEGELPQTYRPHMLSGRYEGFILIFSDKSKGISFDASPPMQIRIG